ncbi:MAG: toxin HicA [Propionibacteriaceae bacterium]|nr:toxin HicA [Propionibacteriaceae bacterium]
MVNIDDLVVRMRANPKGARFADLEKVCRAFFGTPRSCCGSHQVYELPRAGDPRVNIQNFHGQAKP